jgi:pyridinium-3,5-biscarboxylic acid mononucleotide sulfurtransferase
MPGPAPEGHCADSEPAIVDRIARGGRAVVALSGGVDSALVASLAHEALGEEAIAVTITGAAVAPREVDRARAVARSIGIVHLAVPGDPLSDADYRRNGADRCYHCRRVEGQVLRRVGEGRGAHQYLDGIHLDDLADDRPGLRAMDEAGMTHPLLLARWTKPMVRASARRRGLPNWDLPSDACLASRVSRGEPISDELLHRIAAAETVVLAHGFRRVRVRARAGGAVIEVDPDEVDRLSASPLSDDIRAGIHGLGFDPVSIDPRGYGRARSALPMVR